MNDNTGSVCLCSCLSIQYTKNLDRLQKNKKHPLKIEDYIQIHQFIQYYTIHKKVYLTSLAGNGFYDKWVRIIREKMFLNNFRVWLLFDFLKVLKDRYDFIIILRSIQIVKSIAAFHACNCVLLCWCACCTASIRFITCLFAVWKRSSQSETKLLLSLSTRNRPYYLSNSHSNLLCSF